MKRVIFHGGFHKTGSSALQAHLSQLAPFLEENGISYPYPEPDSVVASGGCSGNLLQILYREIGVPLGFENNLRSFCQEAYFEILGDIINQSKNDVVILSGEFFGHLSEEQVGFFRKHTAPHTVEPVFFVRDPFDFAYSTWRQRVKRESYSGRFRDYVFDSETQFSMARGFRRFSDVFDDIHVIRYESHRRNVSSAFFQKIGLDGIFPSGIEAPKPEHNPSLTPSEAELSVAVANAYDNSIATSTVIQSLLGRSHRKSYDYYDRECHERIAEIFSDAIPLINNFLPEHDKLSLELRENADTPSHILPEDAVFTLKVLGDRVFPSVESRRSEGVLSSVSDRLKRVLHRADVDELPGDFDEEAYLFHNPDIAAAGVDPVAHFLAHGKAEGRKYRFK